MIFEATPIEGAFVVKPERHEDERGHFARLWCSDEFAAHGIEVEMVQANVSYTRLAGTLRGMHFAWPPSREGKLVRCSRGRIHDVIVDLRPSSPTFLDHFAIVLADRSHAALFVPHGLAHGFQTLEDDCEVTYMMTDRYRSELAAGYAWDDPAFRIDWPLPVSCIAARDGSYPRFDADAHRRAFSAHTAAAH